MRADQLLVQRGLAASRTQAQRLIEAGRVSADGAAVTRAAQPLDERAELAVTPDAADRFVSRGGLKLAGALAASGVDPRGLTCLDVGQSTGGFTDCLLQAGAARVMGVDVGHGQLHPRLAADARVVALEGVNARAMTLEALLAAMPGGWLTPEAAAAVSAPADAPRKAFPGFDLVVADLSFISLAVVLPAVAPLARAGGELLLLVKPQFEAGPGNVGKGGIVRDPKVHEAVVARVRADAEAAGLQALAVFDSPIAGGDGNREFFLHARRPDAARA